MDIKATNFTLPDQTGQNRSLEDYKGKFVLLYFYPKDMTPGCTVEACSFRDNMNDFKDNDVQVLGISSDSVESHKKFAKKHDLNFSLLSDPDKKVIESFGVWVEKSMFGKKYMGIQRDSFLIGKDGTILKHYKKVKPAKHVAEVLADIKDFN